MKKLVGLVSALAVWARKTCCRCFHLERSSKALTGMILKCKNCERRFKVSWSDYKSMHRDVNIGG